MAKATGSNRLSAAAAEGPGASASGRQPHPQQPVSAGDLDSDAADLAGGEPDVCAGQVAD